MTNPVFSVIIPLYNNDKYIISTIKSVINQTFKNFEIIIIDDKSTDQSLIKTENFIKSYTNIKLIKNSKNLGVYKTINIGLNHIKGEYFTILGSDDIFYEDRLEEDYKSLNNTGYLATISKYSRYDFNNKLVTPSRYGESMMTFHKSVLDIMGNYINCRFGGDTEYMNRFMTLIGKEKVKLNDKNLYRSLLKEDNTNLTKVYNLHHDRKLITRYFYVLLRYYNSTINKNIQSYLILLLPKISISDDDHKVNLELMKIKK